MLQLRQNGTPCVTHDESYRVCRLCLSLAGLSLVGSVGACSKWDAASFWVSFSETAESLERSNMNTECSPTWVAIDLISPWVLFSSRVLENAADYRSGFFVAGIIAISIAMVS